VGVVHKNMHISTISRILSNDDLTHTAYILALGHMFRVTRVDAIFGVVFREAIAMSTLTAILVILAANLCLLIALILMGSLLFNSY